MKIEMFVAGIEEAIKENDDFKVEHDDMFELVNEIKSLQVAAEKGNQIGKGSKKGK